MTVCCRAPVLHHHVNHYVTRLQPLLPIVTPCPHIVSTRNLSLQIQQKCSLSTTMSTAVTKLSDSSTQYLHRDALQIFETSIDSVSPSKMINAVLKTESGSLFVNDRRYEIHKNVYIVGFGKAVAGMARVVEEILGDHIVDGIISVPHGLRQNMVTLQKPHLLLREDSKISMHEGARDNLPDQAAMNTARAIQTLARGLTSSDLLLVLISGGGSALLPLPCPGVTLEETLKLTTLLSKNGATISELNIIRKHIDELKGGGLARQAYPAKVVSLILSDVVGDRLDIIASSPTVLDDTSPQMCLDLIRRLNLTKEIPANIISYLQAKVRERNWEPQDKDKLAKDSEHIQNIIVGSNTMAAQAAMKKAESMGYLPLLLSTTLEGEARERGKMFGKLAKYAAFSYGPTPSPELRQVETDLLQETELEKSLLNDVLDKSFKAHSFRKGFCLIASGETTVQVKGHGLGGRNQEMALACALELDSDKEKLSKYSIQFLSGGTDGQDGPTDAAGGVVSQYFVEKCLHQNLDAETFLEDNDSYNLLRQVQGGSGLVKTGLTGTNVMDVQIILVRMNEGGAST